MWDQTSRDGKHSLLNLNVLFIHGVLWVENFEPKFCHGYNKIEDAIGAKVWKTQHLESQQSQCTCRSLVALETAIHLSLATIVGSNAAGRCIGIRCRAIISETDRVRINRPTSDREGFRKLGGEHDYWAHLLAARVTDLVLVRIHDSGRERVLVLRWIGLLILRDVDTTQSRSVVSIICRLVEIKPLEVLSALGNTAQPLPGTAEIRIVAQVIGADVRTVVATNTSVFLAVQIFIVVSNQIIDWKAHPIVNICDLQHW
jgi:hypothetical protein